MSSHIHKNDNDTLDDGPSVVPEFRCSSCGKLLAKTALQEGDYQVKCVRCGTVNILFKDDPEQIIITDPDGIVLFANNQVEKITGYSVEEIIGKKPSLWGGLMPKNFYVTMWQKIKKEQKPIHVIITNKRKDGGLYDAHLKISPVFAIDGSIKFFVGIESTKPIK